MSYYAIRKLVLVNFQLEKITRTDLKRGIIDKSCSSSEEFNL